MLANNLANLMEKQGVNAVELSKKSGVPQPRISEITSGKTADPRISTLSKLASALNVPIESLVGEPEAIALGKVNSDYVFIPRYEVQASAGGGAVVHSEQIVDHLAFKREWVQNALGIPLNSLALIGVRGDSMEPTLSNGDLILIDLRVQHIDADSIYVLQLNGSLLVKRVQRNFDGSIEITSDNPRYRPSVLQGEGADSLGLIGRVVWCGRRM